MVVSTLELAGTAGLMGRWLCRTFWCPLMLVLSACHGMDPTTATLPPLDSATAIGSAAVSVPVTLGAVPHRAWYYMHAHAIREELLAVHAMVSELAATADPAVLASVCQKGVELDRDVYRAAYVAPDVHPDWVRAVDLTRWMIARCHVDARESVGEVLPLLEPTMSQFEAWVDSLAEG